jgi:hypothetical protein
VLEIADPKIDAAYQATAAAVNSILMTLSKQTVFLI